MDIHELYRLARWYTDQFPRLNSLYRELIAPINHNANNPNKQPVEEQLNALTLFLAEQEFDQLSIEQLKVLSSLGVDVYMGRSGIDYVNSTIKTSDYDPATAALRLNAAIDAINSTNDMLSVYTQAVDQLGLEGQDAEAEDGLITIRVGFQNDVAIRNVTDWKDTSKDWYDIARGLSMACAENPEDVRVIGAATGSIILIMAGTVLFTTLLARISKNITAVSRDIIGVRIEVENLRQKGLLTKVMEAEFAKMEKQKADDAVSSIEKLLDGKIVNKDGDVQNALTSSIKKLLIFSEKGGTVDFVSPEEKSAPNDGEGESDGLKAALIEAREAIREYQGERESLKLLSDGTKRTAGE